MERGRGVVGIPLNENENKSCLVGVLICWFLGILGSWILGFLVLLVSCFCSSPGLSVPCFQSYLAALFLSWFHSFKYQSYNFMFLENVDPISPTISFHALWRVLIPYSRFSRSC